MSENNPIAGVEELAKQANVQKVEKEPTKANKEKFDALMAQEESGKEIAELDAKKAQLNLEETVREKHIAGPLENISPDSILQKTKESLGTIGELKSTLTQQFQKENLEINQTYKTQLRNKLTHVDDSLRIALTKVGAEGIEPSAQSAATINPVERFLGHLSHAQHQLESLGRYVEAMENAESELSPASMLAIQLKANKVQQELEFFANLLNKALEATKTMMNIQV